MLGRLEEARQADQEVLPLAEVLGDLECLVAVPRDLAFIHALRGAFAISRRYVARSLAVAEQMENPVQLSFTLGMSGYLAMLAGEWQRSRADLDRALAVSGQTDRSWHSTYLPIFLARLTLAECNWASAAALQEAVTPAEAIGDLQALRWAATTLAEIGILEGQAGAARARLLLLLDRPGLEECDVTLLLPVLAWTQLEVGQVDEAAATVGQALVRARREDMRLVLVDALRVDAQVAIRQERWAAAARSLEEGLALARAMPYPYAEARLLQVDGLWHAQTGQPAVARVRLEAARALFRQLEAAQVGQGRQALPHQVATRQNATPFQNGSMQAGARRLSDAQWAAIAALLPPAARTGRPRADDRQTIEAILYKLETGCAWSAVPAALGDGVTAHRRQRAWEAAGVWPQIEAIAQAEPRGQPAP
jgi:transposase